MPRHVSGLVEPLAECCPALRTSLADPQLGLAEGPQPRQCHLGCRRPAAHLVPPSPGKACVPQRGWPR
eukprot:7370209-Prorocentrum_lima.AAC.1